MRFRIKLYKERIKNTPKAYIALLWLLGTTTGVIYATDWQLYRQACQDNNYGYYTITNIAEAKTEKKDPFFVIEKAKGEFSAYTMAEDENDETPSINANGTTPHANYSIACPTKYDFGTLVRVNGKIYTCDDRMNARYRQGNYFDIFFQDRTEALNWGRKTLDFEILAPVDNFID